MKPFDFFLISSHIIIIVLLIAIFIRTYRRQSKKNNYQQATSNGYCTKDSCGAIDDVNDPAYNMQNVIKQSILLEEHIAEKNKYCMSCIVKHFQHIIGLVEEAQWMAGSNVNKYPHLKDAGEFYVSIFNIWLHNRANEDMKLQVLDKLRMKRRDLIDVYYLHSD